MAGPTYFTSIQRLIDQAYRNAGKLGQGQTANSEQYAQAFNTLNDVINFLQTKGLKLFLDVDTPLPLVAGTNFYPLGPGASGISMTKPLRVVDAYFLDQFSSRVPMTAVARKDWDMLPVNNSSPGQPTNYFVDKQATTLGVYIWPTPDATSVLGSVHLVLQVQAPNGTGLTDTTSFPVEWLLGLGWTLADELCTGQPPAIVERCANKRAAFLAELEGWDVEDAVTYFTPDTQATTSYGNSFT